MVWWASVVRRECGVWSDVNKGDYAYKKGDTGEAGKLLRRKTSDWRRKGELEA
jgi:hypothetical protein